MTAEIAVAPAPAPPQTFFRRHRWKIILFGFVGVVVAAGALWTAITLTFSYSDGDRIGSVQKLSHRGWICRTWEGELAMTPVPGAQPEIFSFTVRDEAVAKRVKEAEGKRVALHYKESVASPARASATRTTSSRTSARCSSRGGARGRMPLTEPGSMA